MDIENALQMYKLSFHIISRSSGGGFTTYELKPTGSGGTPERLKQKIRALSIATDLQLEMIEEGTRLLLRHRSGIPYYNYFDYNGYIDYNDPDIPFIVGFSNGQIKLDTIDAARHILVAGTTGSGKSVFLHNLIYTFTCNPNNYLYLVDCKRVEFNYYKNNAVVATEVFGDVSAGSITNTFIYEMEKRYKDMEAAGINDFTQYQKIKPQERRYILVIDELSDLISSKQARDAIIPRLLRIAQKGRAAGFHLILATQRPDASIINGTLKGNIPTRIAFKTISRIDSQIILDHTGAEKLAGNGDALYLRNGGGDPERLQAPYFDITKISA